KIQGYLETNGFEIMSANFERFPNGEMKHLEADQRDGVDKLLEALEDDEDVQNVYHNMEL
ncbi:MAG: YebC/PmpR family DNA-binding transcriptional regulator, partial [Bacteroidales bacterium]|nr:YebC/PmpR family DNA-binding transcriptional regulator [Bacteroidales bacterium]